MPKENHIWKQFKEENKKNYKFAIYDFTVPELDYFRELCNFTPSEREYFELRSKGKSNIEIALAMNVSESQVSKLARKVKSKMLRIL